MARVNIPLAGGFYQSDSLPVSAQEAVNMYPSVVQAVGLNQEILFPTPGITQLVANQGVTDEANRGAHVMGSTPYFVNGQRLYSLDRSIDFNGNETFSVTDIGEIEGTGRVWMADNGTQLCILNPGGKGYILTQSGNYGKDLVTNGDFTSDSDWSKDVGWTIDESNQVAVCAAGAVNAVISQSVPITAGKTYRVSYNISTASTGASITPSLGGVNLITRTNSGTYTEEITAINTNDLAFLGNTAASGAVWLDNVTVQELGTTDSLEEITDLDFTANGNPQTVVFIDGYFLFTTDQKKFIVSGLNDGLNYNALDFGSAEADPDDIVAPIVFRNQLFIGGSETIEAFQNVGGADFPFQRTGVFMEKGIVAPFSAINVNQTFMFVGSGKNESPAVWELQGNGLVKVSTTAIDTLLQDLTDAEAENIYAWAYAQKGAYFVGFTLPTTTIVYDTISGRWHERKTFEVNYTSTVDSEPYRVSSIVEGYGRVLVGDSMDGRIGQLDPEVYDEYDVTVTRRVTTQPVQNDMKPFFVPSLELTVESGVGDTATIRFPVRGDNGGIYYVPQTVLNSAGTSFTPSWPIDPSRCQRPRLTLMWSCTTQRTARPGARAVRAAWASVASTNIAAYGAGTDGSRALVCSGSMSPTRSSVSSSN